jgi:hypothetical protein
MELSPTQNAEWMEFVTEFVCFWQVIASLSIAFGTLTSLTISSLRQRQKEIRHLDREGHVSGECGGFL